MKSVSARAYEARFDGVDFRFDVIHDLDPASDERLAHARRCTNVLSPARFVAEPAEERVPEAARECSHEGS